MGAPALDCSARSASHVSARDADFADAPYAVRQPGCLRSAEPSGSSASPHGSSPGSLSPSARRRFLAAVGVRQRGQIGGMPCRSGAWHHPRGPWPGRTSGQARQLSPRPPIGIPSPSEPQRSQILSGQVFHRCPHFSPECGPVFHRLIRWKCPATGGDGRRRGKSDLPLDRGPAPAGERVPARLGAPDPLP